MALMKSTVVWWGRIVLAVGLFLVVLTFVLNGVDESSKASSPAAELQSTGVIYAMWFLASISFVLFGVFLFLLSVSLYSEIEERRTRAHALGQTILNWYFGIGAGAAGLIGFTRF